MKCNRCTAGRFIITFFQGTPVFIAHNVSFSCFVEHMHAFHQTMVSCWKMTRVVTCFVVCHWVVQCFKNDTFLITHLLLWSALGGLCILNYKSCLPTILLYFSVISFYRKWCLEVQSIIHFRHGTASVKVVRLKCWLLNSDCKEQFSNIYKCDNIQEHL